MAIDDSTSYELTGAQVKDLANKIKGKAADNIFVGATSSAPGSKGLVPQPQAGDNTKFLKGDGSWQSVANNYSTTEQATGTTWIDDKPIYKKTIDCGPLPNAATKTVAHGISNIGIIVKYEAIATYGSNSTQIPIPFTSDNTYAQVSIRVEPASIVLWCQADRSSATSYVTLYYTKTTD